ncbi:hypothetical protein [Magnetospirillum aberrantis]|uniref:Uncharacterized protein n=1 Tax=Magnetospirillum aberrantis SpK TaxID=908842 RepID=A0A7C9QRQ3_9PROT|nr:hypothetical protein [Magnetospirillum aberrantis]NFV79000.1 hypothetical protein [Magnetospirillum aberrantis SpK]
MDRESEIMERVRSGERIEGIGCSLSEELTVRLALGLGVPASVYAYDPWDRLDERQRQIVQMALVA